MDCGVDLSNGNDWERLGMLGDDWERSLMTLPAVCRPMEYLVTGATGLIGTNVVEQLVADGHDVRALTRDRDNATHLPDPVTVVEGDITDRETLREPMAGVDGVFHAAAWFFVGPGPREVERAERINVEGTRNVLELVDELDVPKAVYTSTIGTYPGRGHELIDETVVPECPTFSVYNRTKWEAHHEVAKPMVEDGLPLVILMPGSVYGQGDKLEGSMREIFRDYLTGNMPLAPRDFAMPYDHAEDIARAHVLAMERGREGEEYIVGSEATTALEVLDCAERLTGIPAPRTLPGWVFGALERPMRLVERVTTPPAGLEPELLSFMAGREWRVDATKAREELGVEFRDLEEGLAEYLAWELEQLGDAVTLGEDAALRERAIAPRPDDRR